MSVETEFSRASEIEPELRRLEKFVATLFRGDLPTVENWVLRFNRIMERRPELHQHRKAVFGHLLEVHNQATERAAERSKASTTAATREKQNAIRHSSTD